MTDNHRSGRREGRAQSRPTLRCTALLLLIVLTSPTATAACTKRDDANDDAKQGGFLSSEGPPVPIAPEKPIGAEEAIRPPAAKPEPLLGKAVLVVDSSSKSVYEFDTVRGRFRGPAPEVALPDRLLTLPGYPVPVSDEFPQNAAVVGSHVVVAGGLDGTAVFLDRSTGDLGVVGKLQLPVRQVVLEDSGKQATNADADLKRPFILLMSPFGRDRVLAVSRENTLSTSVGYVIDVVSKRLLAAAQLPGGLAANHVRAYRDTAIAAMSTRKLVFLSADLRSAREIPLPGNPTDFTIIGDTAYVSLRDPSALVKVDLVSGAVSPPLSNKPEETIGGPVAVEDRILWWAHTKLGTITRVDVVTGKATEIPACESISSMVRHEKALYLSCPGTKTFGVIHDGKPIVRHKVDGFPISVAGPL